MSLLEIIIAVALLASVGAAVMGTFVTAMRSSSYDRIIASEQAWLVSSADMLSGPGVPYVHCSTALADYQATLDARVGGAWPATAIAVTAVETFDGTAFSAACPPDLGGPQPAQRVTVTVDEGRAAGRSVEFIKTGVSP